jgi:hypothetical protein
MAMIAPREGERVLLFGREACRGADRVQICFDAADVRGCACLAVHVLVLLGSSIESDRARFFSINIIACGVISS